MQGTQIAHRLAEIDLFAGLSDATRQELAQRATRMTFEAGALITEQGEAGASFVLITDGTADVEVNGIRRATLSAGDYLGEIALIDRQPRSATVRAGEGGVSVAAISPLAFAPVLDDPAACKGLLAVLCARLRAAEAASRAS